MICTNTSGQMQSCDEDSERSRQLLPADFHSECYVSYCTSPLLPFCHEAALAPEEGTRVRGGPPSGKWHRGRLRSGTEGACEVPQRSPAKWHRGRLRSDAEKQLASDPEGARKVPQRALERSAEREP